MLLYIIILIGMSLNVSNFFCNICTLTDIGFEKQVVEPQNRVRSQSTLSVIAGVAEIFCRIWFLVPHRWNRRGL